MKKFPTFCVDDFYEYPDEVREFALRQTFHKMPSCIGIRTSPMKDVQPEFDDYFNKKLLTMFYDILDPSLQYVVKNVFHKNYPVENKNHTLYKPEELLWGSRYGGTFRSDNNAHLDPNNVISGVIFLNKEEEMHAGVAIYRPVGYSEEHDGALLQETARFSQVYNRLVAFDGETWHGRVGDNTIEDRLCQVFFVQHVSNQLSPIEKMRQIA